MNGKTDDLKARYHELGTVLETAAIRRSLAEIDQAARFGMPGDTQPVLAMELDWAKERGAGQESPELMLLLVGYSPEPLLLSLAFHRPERVILLRSQSLDNEEYLSTFRQLWDRYHGQLDLPGFEQVDAAARTVRESPEGLFQEVCRQVDAFERAGGDRSRILLEITGAKKSMIAGAFLAAGFLDLGVSYVDFESYDPVLRRPDPETCRPVALHNPYRLFKLREQDQLRTAFEGRRFGEARRLAEALCEMVQRPELRSLLADEAREQQARYARLAEVAKGCGYWSEGFYREARERLEAVVGCPVAPTLSVLGGVWPRRDARRGEIVEALGEEHVFADARTTLAYLVDTLVWTDEAMATVHPRASYLRLFGSLESIFFFAFDALAVRSGALEIEPDDTAALETLSAEHPSGPEGPIDWQAVLRAASIAFFRMQSSYALKVLGGESGWHQPMIPKGIADLSHAERSTRLPRIRARLDEPPIPKKLVKKLGRQIIRFKDLRNKVAHWVAPVPPVEVRKLREVVATAIHGLVPAVVESRIATAAPALDSAAIEALGAWQDRLLATAEGRPPGDCLPPGWPQLGEQAATPPESHLPTHGAKA